MYQKKPTPLVTDLSKKICPVCGKQSYSAGGIHPQCAVLQADAPREKKLKEKRVAAERKRSAAGKPTQVWRKKSCPKCGLEVHVRKKACDCGFEFLKS